MASRNALAQRTTNIPVAQQPAQGRKRALETGDDENNGKKVGAVTRRALTAANLENLAPNNQDGKPAKRAKLSREGWQVDRATVVQPQQAPVSAVVQSLDPHEKARAQQQALANWINTYKTKLPTFVFYFDSVPADEVRKTTRRIQAFKGVCLQHRSITFSY